MPPGRLNALTDVPGVKVGQVSLVRGSGKLRPGKGPVRCGVTAIIPATGNLYRQNIAGAVHVINGYGKSLGLTQIAETGRVETPVLLTGTLNVWRAADALVDWVLERNRKAVSINPVVMECSPHWLDDVRGRHVGRREVFRALSSARRGPVEEGNVGGGTGMKSFGFKSGIGTSSRRVAERAGGWTVGTLVMANAGAVQYLRVAGFPFGKELVRSGRAKASRTALTAAQARRGAGEAPNAGSLICVTITDAPLSARQLRRLAARAGIGLGRAGLNSIHPSGDICLALSNARRTRREETRLTVAQPQVPDGQRLEELFNGAMEAAEEAYLNAVLGARSMAGAGGKRIEELPLDALREYLERVKS